MPLRRLERAVGLKPSGGIRTSDEAFAYVDLADEVMGYGLGNTRDVPLRCERSPRRTAHRHAVQLHLLM